MSTENNGKCMDCIYAKPIISAVTRQVLMSGRRCAKMKNLLNSPEAFAAACVGSGIAFGISTLFALGTPFAGKLISLSVISFTVAALTHLVLRLDEKAQKKKGPFDANQNGPNKKNICSCIIADYGENVKGGSR